MSAFSQEAPWRFDGHRRKPAPFTLQRVKDFTAKKFRPPSLANLLSTNGRPSCSYGIPGRFNMEARWPFKATKKYFRLDPPDLGEVEPLPVRPQVQVIKTIQATGIAPARNDGFKTMVSKFKRACGNLNPRLAAFKFLWPDSGSVNPEQKITVTRLGIESLLNGEWAGGLQLVTLKLDLDLLCYESQLWIFEGLKLNALRSLTLWNMQPSDQSMAHLSNNLPNLIDLDIFYAFAPEAGVKVIPDLSSLQCVSLACLSGKVNSPIRISSHHVLKNLRRVDLGHFTIDQLWVRSTFPMAPQVQQLTVYGSHQKEFIEFHFPNLKFLSYFAPQPELVCVSRLPQLEYLAFSSTCTLPPLASHSLRCLDLFNRTSLEPEFWLWLAHSFPNLTQLRLFSTHLTDYAFPNPGLTMMSKLEAVSCQIILPEPFWIQLSSLAPNAADTSSSYFSYPTN